MRWHFQSDVEGLTSLTVRACKSLQLANQEAHRLHDAEVTRRHLLLGLVKDGFGVAGQAFASLEINTPIARRRMGCREIPDVESSPAAVPGRLPLSRTARQILDDSIRISQEMGHEKTGTGHLLLALISQKDPSVQELFAQLDVSGEEVRTITLTLLGKADWLDAESVRHPVALGKRYYPGLP